MRFFLTFLISLQIHFINGMVLEFHVTTKKKISTIVDYIAASLHYPEPSQYTLVLKDLGNSFLFQLC